MQKNTSTVCVLGASGMLGSMVLDVLAKEGAFNLVATVRGDVGVLQKRYPAITVRSLDAETASEESIGQAIKGCTWVINAIGIIKPYIHDDNKAERERAIRVNSLFPSLLASAAANSGAQVLQIATDCVYSGLAGKYVESSACDALDVYGKSKNLGEVPSPVMHHLRCSIIGPEPKAHVSLLDWFLGQKEGAEVNGFTNHQWNGVTTYHFARLCQGVIEKDLSLGLMQHVIPGSMVTKADLLKTFAKAYGRHDIKVNPVAADKIVDRTLATENEAQNLSLWKASGYETPPSIEEMVLEMSQYQPIGEAL